MTLPTTLRLRLRPIAAGLLFLLVAPTGSAGWSGFGGHEPDTAYDTHAVMFPDPPTSASAKRVYLNGFTTQLYAHVNPNVGAVGTQQETALMDMHEAVLGIWVDCNGDGYIGMAESAAREYPSELLLGQGTICPPSSGEPQRWRESMAHNYNGWVSELIAIGPASRTRGDGRIVTDWDARVWADHGRPGEAPSQASCALYALPPGGARSTGRLLDHADCHASVVAGTRSADEASALGLLPAGDRWSQSEYDAPTLGDENGPAYVEAQDCDEEPIALTGREPPGDDLDDLRVPSLRPNPGIHPEGSAAATVADAVTVVAEDKWGEPMTCTTDERARSDASYGLLEGDVADVDPREKDRANWNLRFHVDARGSGLAALRYPTSTGAPSDLGVEALRVVPREIDAQHVATRWYADAPNIRKMPVLARAALADGSADLPPATFYTYYAHVGAATRSVSGIALPGGSGSSGRAGTYGAEPCGLHTSGVHGGWQCDPARWNGPWPRPDDVVVGRPYSLRDVDCYDGSNHLGVPTGLAAYGPESCHEASA